MAINYSSRQQEMINRILELEYGTSPEMIVDDALELLLSERKLVHLRKRLKESLAEVERGEVRELTPQLIEEIRANGKEKHRTGSALDPDVIP